MNGTALILTGARRRVAEGWAQHRAFDEHGNVCAGHAIDQAFPEFFLTGQATPSDRADACEALLHEASAMTGARQESIPNWNDAPRRTKAEVLVAFDRAIARVGGSPAVENPVEKIVIDVPVAAPKYGDCTPIDFAVDFKTHLVIPPMPVEHEPATRWEKVKALVGV